MELVLRGRRVGAEDLEQIRGLIALHPGRGLYFLSQELCRLWDWRQPNGALKDTSCRVLLYGLADRDLLTLPARQRGAIRGRPKGRGALQTELPFAPFAQGTPPLSGALEWRPALRGPDFFLYKRMLQDHHYLGYRRLIGPNLRYLACAHGQPIACLGWAAAAQKVSARDRLIGWSHAQRLKNLHLVVNNARFLVVPRVPHLASRLLAANVRRLAADWQARYGYAPVLLETFVDTTRFKGTCYKAANWISAGLTQGRGKYDRHTRQQETVKAVFLYPLRPDFRQVLCHG